MKSTNDVKHTRKLCQHSTALHPLDLTTHQQFQPFCTQQIRPSDKLCTIFSGKKWKRKIGTVPYRGNQSKKSVQVVDVMYDRNNEQFRSLT